MSHRARGLFVFVLFVLICAGWVLVGYKASAHEGPIPAWALAIIGKDFSHMRVAYESESSCEVAKEKLKEQLAARKDLIVVCFPAK
jgi:hypothetical protein